MHVYVLIITIKKSERKFQLTGAGHDTSPDQEEKNQGSDTLVTLHPNRAHLFRLRRGDTSLVVRTACWRLSNKVLSPEISLKNERNATKESSDERRVSWQTLRSSSSSSSLLTQSDCDAQNTSITEQRASVTEKTGRV